MSEENPEHCDRQKCPIDAAAYIQRMAEMKNLIDQYAKDRKDEAEARHNSYAATSEVIDRLRTEVMTMDGHAQATRKDVRTLQEIARDTNSLLQGVMGRPGMVAQVGEQQGQLSTLTELVRQNTNAVAHLTESVSKHETKLEDMAEERKGFQRIVWMVMGGLAVLQILVQILGPKLLGQE